MRDARVGSRIGAPLLCAVAGALAAGCAVPVRTFPPAQAPRTARAPRAAPTGERQRPQLSHPRLQHMVLPSGMRLLLDEDPHATAAAVVSVVAGGSGTDPPGAEGLAHLVEHLVYRAVDPPPPAPPGGAASVVPPVNRRDRLTHHAVVAGNAHTTHDCLIFYEMVPTARLDEVLALAVARLADPLVGVDEDAFARERRIVGNEIVFRDDPRRGAWAIHALLPLLFPPPHLYNRSPAGTDDSRRKLTLAQARAYATQNFRPERMTLLVTAPPGDTSLEAIAGVLPPALRGDASRPVARPAAAAAGKPAARPAGAAPPAPPAAAAAPAPASSLPARVERRSSPLPTPELWIGWTLPGVYGTQGPAQELLARWVRQDVGSEQLIQEEPKIRHVETTLQPGREASVLFVRALLAEGADPDRVARVLVARVSSVWAREPTQRETFVQLKNLYEAQQALDEPPQLPRAIQQAMLAGLGERPTPMADISTALQSVPSTAIAELAYRHLTRERARAVMFTPAPAAPEPALAAAAQRTTPADAAAARELVAGAGGWNPGELRDLLPARDAVTATKLPGGLTVVTARRPSAAVVAWLAFKGGASDAEPPLLVQMAVHVRPEATQATKLHILPGRGATRDMSFDTVQFLPDRLPESLALLFAKATAPVKEWPTREGIARLLAPVLAAEDDLSRKADRDFWRAMFGDHPHAHVISADDVDKLTRSDVDAWLGRVHTVRNAALIVVGDVNPREVERAAAVLARQLKTPAWVTDLPMAPAPTPRSGKDAPAAPVAVISGRPGTLTEVRLGCLLPQMAAADRGHYELLTNAIEARLDAALRVDDGDSYGVQVAFDRLRGGTTLLVATTFVEQQTLSRSLAAIRGNWQRWARDGFDAGEINVARWRYAGSLTLASQSGHALAFELAKAWANEPEALGTDRMFPDVVGLKAARVNELFATCKANAVLSLTGNETAIRRAADHAWPGLARRRR